MVKRKEGTIQISVAIDRNKSSETGRATVCRLFEEQAERTPHYIALIAGTDVGPDLVQVSYKVLNEKAGRLAASLRGKGIKPDDIVAMSVEPSVNMIFGILGILKAGATYLPIPPDAPEERKEYILKDSNAKLLLSETSEWSETIEWSEMSEVIQPTQPTQLCYIIYTSGSTGRPRGVMVEHRNLTAYLAAFEREFSFTHRDTVLQQASYAFDTFAEEIYPALLKGGKVAVADRKTVRDGRLLTDFIIKHGVTIIDCSPLLLNELNTRLPMEASHLRLPAYTFISGGDVLKYRYIDNLLKLGTVYNTYGPTEATICASYYRCEEQGAETPVIDVPIGKPIANYSVNILDKNGNPAPPGEVGELTIAGAGVTRGYLNNPELTNSKFQITNHSALTPYPLPLTPYSTPYYRTGDLGRLLPDGNISFTGRIDFQVKIRGYRIELGEVEAMLVSHPDIKEAVVIAKEAAGEKYLTAYIVPTRNTFDTSQLHRFLAAQLPAYMIPTYFTLFEQMPLTTSGKLDRNALPVADRRAGENIHGCQAPENGIQNTLANMWRDVFKINKIGIHDNFFQLGGHSLKAMTLAAKVHKEFNVELRVADLFENPTIKEIADVVTGKGKLLFTPMEAVEEREYYPPSPMQKRFYILNRMEGIGVAYNIPDMKILEGKIDLRRVENSCRELIRRHESLRTSFHLIDGELVQRVHRPGELNCSVDYFQVTGDRQRRDKKIKAILGQLIQPFDLSRPPLIRAALVELEPEKHLFLYDMHHIAADGLSSLILEEELVQLLGDRDLPPVTGQYKVFSQRQNRMLESGELKKQETYWLDQFNLEIPVLALPTDYPPPRIQSFEGDQIDFQLKNPLKDRMYQLIRETGTTLYMLLLAAFNVLLNRYTGQEDIVVGSPVAGRKHDGMEGIVGLCINVLALRNYPTGEQSFGQFLRRVKENTLNAFENQDYPYGALLDSLGIKKDLSRNPLFSVELVVQNVQLAGTGAGIRYPGFSQYGYKMNIAQLDISLLVVEEPEAVNCSVIYCTRLLKRETMERAARRFTGLLEYLVIHPDTWLSDIPFLTEEERRHILVDFNSAVTPLPDELFVFRLFEAQVSKTPDNIALVNREHISYKELNEKAGRLAGILQGKGVRPDHIVGILTGPSIEMFIGLLGILKAGGAYLPLNPDSPQERIRYILVDSGAKILLISENRNPNFETNSKNQNSNAPNGAVPPMVLDFEDLDFKKGCPCQGFVSNFQFRASDLSPSNLAYVIYTSGSTGRPKGVLIEHRQLTAYLTAFQREFTITARDIVVQQSAYFFDAFAEEVYPILLNGGKIAVPDKRQVPDARYLTDFIIRHQVNIIDCSPLLLNELNKRLPHEASRIHLPAYTFISGGDVLKSEYIHRLLHLGTVYNTYGPTETTVCATYYRCTFSRDPLDSRVPIGKPIANYQVYILDKNGNPVPPSVVGELHIAGTGVARGYLNQPDLTNSKFQITNHNPLTPYPSSTSAGTPGPLTPLYRTGDLAKWMPDGAIEFIGRIDFQVNIRGFRIEPGEIEAQLNTHPVIEQSIVLACENGSGEKNLCAYVLPISFSQDTGAVGLPDFNRKSIPPTQLREYLSNRLPAYMVPAYFITILQLPLTPTGKIDNNALPRYEHMMLETEYDPPRNELEHKLAEMWAVLLEIDKSNISRDANFFHLGGHSLKATQLVTELHKELNVKISMVDVFSSPTIRDLARCIEDTGETRFISIKPTEKKEYYSLSPAQIRMYIGQQLDPETPGYNVSDVILIEGEVKKQNIERLSRKLIARHESFRTSFHMIGREPVQKIHELVDYAVEYYDLSPVVGGTTFPSSFISLFIRPFDLSRAPLIRMGLSKISNEKHLLIMDMHHIISDGLSLHILTREFTALYSRKVLTPLRLQYKDYSQWINKRLEEREVEIVKQEEYWLKQFQGKIPVLTLPQDSPRPAIKNFQGRRINFTLEEMLPYHLHVRAAEEGSTLYILLLALFNIFLAKISGNNDIIIGTPVAGRRHPDLQPIIGMFVNTLALRNYPSGEKTIHQFLGEVKTRSLESFENQDHQFEELVNKLEVQRDASRNPLFDVMFTLRAREKKNVDIPHPEIQELPASYDYSTRVALFDLTLLAIEDEEALSFTFEYSTKLFREETIERFIDYFKRIVSSILAKPGLKLSQIEIISPGEKRKLMVDINNTYTNYPKHKTIHKLFEEQAGKTPDKIAIVGTAGDSLISYAFLNERAGRLARRLQRKGLVPNNVAAVMGERSIEVITGLLAILKCGAAYLPIASHYPMERQRYIARDVQAALLLTPFSKGIPGGPETVLTVDGEYIEETSVNASPVSSESPAYILYTSGSTGIPKGVMVRHYSVTRLVKNTDFFHFREDSRILQTCALEFDASIFEIWGALLNGMTFFLTTREQVSWLEMVKRLLRINRITSIWLTAPLFNQVLDADIDIFSGLGDLMVGGDTLSPPHINRLRETYPELNIINGYGPTENTTFSTTFRINTEYNRNIPIGKPIANSTVYILDSVKKPLPVGITGELCVGGDGVAMGYVNKPELTAEKFISNPFVKGGILYRTGDLARWMPDGNIEFQGRVDSQVKIRGNRIELGEIEHSLSSHPGVKEAAIVVRRKSDGDRYICAYYVPGADGDTVPVTTTDVLNFLTENLPDFMIPSYFVRMEKFPLSAGGKVDKRKLPEPDFGELVEVYSAPADEVEGQLVEIWAEILGIDTEIIGVQTNFFHLGGHSLKATLLITRLHRCFNVRVQFSELFRLQTVRKLADYIKKKQYEKYETIEPVESKEYYPLAPEQVGIYERHQSVVPNTTIFNMPWIGEPDGIIDTDIKKLEEIFLKLIERHENLRTSFQSVGDTPVQRIHKQVNFKINYYKIQCSNCPNPYGNILRHFVRPFNLSRAPLLRVGLVKKPDRKPMLMMDMHHIVSDGTSFGIILKELKTLSKGDILPPLYTRYKDYAQWQANGKRKETLKKQGNYWLEQFKGEIPVLDLPTDYPRPPVKNLKADVLRFELNEKDVSALRTLAGDENRTLFMLILTLFYLLLFKLTGRRDIIVSTFTSGRRDPEIQQIVGMFVNTLPLRNFPAPDKIFKDFLTEVGRKTLDAYENQGYHFDNLVEKLVIKGEGRNPLADVNVVLQNFEMQESEMEGVLSAAGVFKNRTSFYDLRFEGYEKDKKLIFDVEYDWKLFKKATIERFIKQFRAITSAVLENPGKTLSEYF